MPYLHNQIWGLSTNFGLGKQVSISFVPYCMLITYQVYPASMWFGCFERLPASCIGLS